MGRFALLLLVVLAALWLQSPRSVETDYAVSTSGGVRVGESLHVGQLGMVRRDVTVLWVRPRVVGEGTVELRVCDRSGGSGNIGSIHGEGNIHEYCPTLEPLLSGTRLSPNPPDGDSSRYVVATLRSGNTGPFFFCGMEMLYRSGPRIGFTRHAGTAFAVAHAPGGAPFTDENGEPDAFPQPQDDPC